MEEEEDEGRCYNHLGLGEGEAGCVDKAVAQGCSSCWLVGVVMGRNEGEVEVLGSLGWVDREAA